MGLVLSYLRIHILCFEELEKIIIVVKVYCVQ